MVEGETSLSLEPADAGAVLAAVQASPAKTVVMNVWATWCGPCREEFPDLLRLREAYAADGLELMLVSADFEDRLDDAETFLAEQGVDFHTWIKTGDDMQFIDALNPEWGGALPATFVYDSGGRLRAFWEGKASYEQLEQRVLPILEESNR
jgi:thiol-disulfide isomerase/thioredoxin